LCLEAARRAVRRLLGALPRFLNGRRQPAGQSAFYRQIAAGTQRHTDEIEPLLDRISAPTLVVWGEADPWLPGAVGAELPERIPGTRLAPLPGAGHLVQEDQPDELTRLLAEHLESVFT
jgi:pimeloyl-ACP methyl ester carboxylesterase